MGHCHSLLASCCVAQASLPLALLQVASEAAEVATVVVTGPMVATVVVTGRMVVTVVVTGRMVAAVAVTDRMVVTGLTVAGEATMVAAVVTVVAVLAAEAQQAQQETSTWMTNLPSPRWVAATKPHSTA